jgi:hypothetical protein
MKVAVLCILVYWHLLVLVSLMVHVHPASGQQSSITMEISKAADFLRSVQMGWELQDLTLSVGPGFLNLADLPAISAGGNASLIVMNKGPSSLLINGPGLDSSTWPSAPLTVINFAHLSEATVSGPMVEHLQACTMRTGTMRGLHALMRAVPPVCPVNQPAGTEGRWHGRHMLQVRGGNGLLRPCSQSCHACSTGVMSMVCPLQTLARA